MTELQNALLDWYLAHRRDLPWRRSADPYRVWLSEIMCQQTRVDTVIPYYERFLKRWPTVVDLAAAPLEDVLSEWAGLGYYSRARNLHRAAVLTAASGGFPSDVQGLKALPGVGDYTAGAIASIAFGRDAAVVDGNVERVLTRLAALSLDPRSTPGRKAVWGMAESLLAKGQAGTWNQALMELGAMVCRPRSPDCEICPIVSDCAAQASGDPQSWPRKAPRKAPTRVSGVCGAWVRDGSVLMGRRPAPGLLGGLWELPGPTWVGCDGAQEQLTRAFEDRCGARVLKTRLLGEVVHVFTHRHLMLEVYAVEASGDPVASWYTEVAWLDAEARQGEALSTLARKTLRLLD